MAVSPAPNQATGSSAGLELRIVASGARVRVTFRNVSDQPFLLYGAVDAPGQGATDVACRTHHDHLRAELTSAASGTPRVLLFADSRDASPLGIVELGVGAQITDELDFVSWAAHPVNGAPLAPGEYALTVTYQSAVPGAWTGTVTAGPIALHV